MKDAKSVGTKSLTRASQHDCHHIYEEYYTSTAAEAEAGVEAVNKLSNAFHYVTLFLPTKRASDAPYSMYTNHVQIYVSGTSIVQKYRNHPLRVHNCILFSIFNLKFNSITRYFSNTGPFWEL